MLAGISTASLFSRKNNEDAVATFQRFSVPTAEVFLTSFSEYDEAFGRLVADNKGDLPVHSVHVLNTQFEPQLFSKNPRVKADAYAWLQRAMESARAFGASHYTFHGTARIKKADRSGLRDDFSHYGVALREIGDFCARYGIRLCLENVEWATYNRVGVFSSVLPYAPNLGAVLDVKQARLSGYPYEDYLAEMGEKITHVHVSDTRPDGKMCLPGQGTFDFDTLVNRLKDVGFDGPLLIEVYAGDYAEEIELRRAVDFLTELLYKKNCLSPKKDLKK